MADIFISYASEDRARVRPLAEALQARGYSVWWDRTLAAGQDYAAVIERELRSARAVLVVWTQSSVVSTFVRDEAGRGRDNGRLAPVLLDRVEIPLGFGAIQAEDFTQWNGAANARQMQILDESLRARIEAREVSRNETARKRQALATRLRIIAVLAVFALLAVIAWGANDLIRPAPAPVDVRADLLRLLSEGQLPSDQARELAQLLEAGAVGDAAPANASPEAGSDGVAPADTAPFVAVARETYRAAFVALSQHPDAQVRQAAAQLGDAATRAGATRALLAYAQNNPDDPLRDEMYRLCGAVGEANGDPIGLRALEIAANVVPDDAAVWEMLSHAYARTARAEEARGASLVAEAAAAQGQGQPDVAEQRLQQALTALTAPELRAPVIAELGQAAFEREDWTSASARFAESYRLRALGAQRRPSSALDQVVQADAQLLVRALDRSGRTREACERLRQAQEAHNVAAPDQTLLERCRTQYQTELQPRVELAPQLRRGESRRPREAPAGSP